MYRKASIPTALLALLIGFGGLTLAACDNDGPLEQAGEKADKAIDNAGDQIDKAGDKADEAAHDVKRDFEDATD